MLSPSLPADALERLRGQRLVALTQAKDARLTILDVMAEQVGPGSAKPAANLPSRCVFAC